MARYPQTSDYRHGTPARLGVLLTNLGTPDAPEAGALRRYLAEFLSDPRVVELPRVIWLPILHGVILNTRPRRSAKAYRSVWTDAGSPLLRIARQQVAGVAERLEARYPGRIVCELGMRYGNPSIPSALERLQKAGVQRLIVLPLYPQYSASTTGSTFDAVAKTFSRWRWLPSLRMPMSYHTEAGYIAALADSVRDYRAAHGSGEKLLFSFHGIPKSYFEGGDPYHCHCQMTARLVAQQLGLADSEWLVSFQSRFGPREWLKPYTDETVKSLAQQGVGRIDVLAPGFSADCLETLEELAIQNREFFEEAGGHELHYIPALNDAPVHLDFLADFIAREASGWPEVAADFDAGAQAGHLALQEARARAMGAAR
jgi:protoporphyrin/coproporphyrin ferrochelatase